MMLRSKTLLAFHHFSAWTSRNAAFPSSGWDVIANLDGLEELVAEDSNITAGCLGLLAEKNHLESLDLSGLSVNCQWVRCDQSYE